MTVKDARCIAIYGRRGSGKSTRTKALIAKAPRVVVFDPMGEYAGERGFVRAGSLAAVRDRMRSGWGRGFKIAYVPTGDFQRMGHGLARLVWQAQEPYFQGRDARQILMVYEEMNITYPAHKLPSQYYGIGQATLQGRHRGIGVIGVTQRPALISMDFRGNVSETYVFTLGTRDDLRAVAEVYSDASITGLKALRPHEFIRLSDDGAVPGKNPPLRKR